ncbi:MAG: hypothetical protein AB7O90_19410 [Hyphomicrobium sp.]
MQLVFRTIGVDEVEKEVTQRDQFNSDEVELVEALVREAHQNSLDALDEEQTSTVRTRLSFHTPPPEGRRLFEILFRDLPAHLKASKVDFSGLDFSSPKFLVIEDFGTTGLKGAYDHKDAEPFSDFWRRIGKSHKGGQQGGRWGLGKLVFSGVSRARTFFGLTVRSDDSDRQPLLMGQAVLTTHKDRNGNDLDAHGFFCEPRDPDRFQLPIRDAALVRNFSKAAGISRTTEPGLSIAIPFIHDDISSTKLVSQLVRNYFFPILMGQLASDVDGIDINASTFDALAKAHGGPHLADGRLVSFIRELRAALDRQKPDLTLPEGAIQSLARSLTDEQLTTIRTKYAAGQMVQLRIPVTLRHRSKGDVRSHFDVFMRTTDGDAHALVVRGAITLPLEAAQFRARRTFGALIAQDNGVTEFLGDAENPAHTKWNGNADKLAENWINPVKRLREIRATLNAVADLLLEAQEKIEPDALIDVLSIPSSAGVPRPKGKQVADPRKVPVIKSKTRKYKILSRHGGFAIAAGPGLLESDLPTEIKVSAAYDLIRGDPFRKHNALDFDLRQEGNLKVTVSGAKIEVTDANEMRVTAEAMNFEIAVSGFDPNRDVVVRAAG